MKSQKLYSKIKIIGKTGDFYYKTGVKTIYGIIATITAGKSIFWKLSKE